MARKFAYEAEKDKELYTEAVEVGDTRLIVAVRAYNEGQPKLQISRLNKLTKTQEWMYTRLGRLTKQEFEHIWPLLEKARAFLG